MKSALLAGIVFLLSVVAARAQTKDSPAGKAADPPDYTLKIVDGKPVVSNLPPVSVTDLPKSQPAGESGAKAVTPPPESFTQHDPTWEDVGDICLIVLISLTCFAGFLYVLSVLNRRA